LRILHHERSLGQSTSLWHAGRRPAAAGWPPWMATARTTRRTSRHAGPGACNEGLAGGIKLVAGHRVNRRDTASKRWASRFANGLRSRLLKDATPDTGCGLKLIDARRSCACRTSTICTATFRR
jgi:dolichol-phosphate mannosyltransferase